MAEGERDSERGEKTTAEDQLKKVCCRSNIYLLASAAPVIECVCVCGGGGGGG